jgi:peptidoglycan hydrolase FlgJ
MNLSFPTESIPNPASKLSESLLASGANDHGNAGFSSVLSGMMKPNAVGAEESDSNVHAPEKDIEQEKLREAFHNFVGQTFFSQMLSSLRSTQEGAAYFNGGQTEKIFQGQLDQILSEELTKSSADQIADPMFELFQLQRSQ